MFAALIAFLAFFEIQINAITLNTTVQSILLGVGCHVIYIVACFMTKSKSDVSRFVF